MEGFCLFTKESGLRVVTTLYANFGFAFCELLCLPTGWTDIFPLIQKVISQTINSTYTPAEGEFIYNSHSYITLKKLAA